METLRNVGAAPIAAPTPVAGTRHAAGAVSTRAAAGRRAALSLLFLASGAATLVYQVLWQRQLATLFGGHDAPPNTGAPPILEALAARKQSDFGAGRSQWIVGGDLVDFDACLHETTPPARDPYLDALDTDERGFVRAGEILYRAFVALDAGDDDEARRMRDAFRDLVPYGTYEMFASGLARADRER